MISIENLEKYYGQKRILSKVYLNFSKSQIHGVVGKNGAGKSTLFSCIAGIEGFDGTINFSDQISQDKIGYLSTTPHVMSKITGYEYLYLLCNARKIKATGLKDKNIFNLPLHEYAQHYSTGMKKKLALMAILMQQNDVFLLDEPFNGLDLESNIMLKEILIRLKNKNKLILISSHLYGSLYDICDTISYIKDTHINQLSDRLQFESIEKDMIDMDFDKRLNDLIL